MRGFVYVLANEAIPGLLKIGYTTRTVEERIQELTTTGVPGRFVAEFYCEVDDAPYLEKVVHAKLFRRRYDKEFFRCDPPLAVKAIKELLFSEAIGLIGSGGRSSTAYLSEDEVAQIRERENRRIEAERMASAERAARAKRVTELASRFVTIAPAVSWMIRQNKIGGFREAAGLLLILTGVGMLVADQVSPPEFDAGKRIARKITGPERETVRELKRIVADLRSVSAFDEAIDEYKKKYSEEPSYLVTTQTYGKGRYDISGLLSGLFSAV